jgi:hypothetical protein
MVRLTNMVFLLIVIVCFLLVSCDDPKERHLFMHSRYQDRIQAEQWRLEQDPKVKRVTARPVDFWTTEFIVVYK